MTTVLNSKSIFVWCSRRAQVLFYQQIAANIFASGILKPERRCRMGVHTSSTFTRDVESTPHPLIPVGLLKEIPIEQGLPWCLAMDEACWTFLERNTHYTPTACFNEEVWSMCWCRWYFFLKVFQQRWYGFWRTTLRHRVFSSTLLATSRKTWVVFAFGRIPWNSHLPEADG